MDLDFDFDFDFSNPQNTTTCPPSFNQVTQQQHSPWSTTEDPFFVKDFFQSDFFIPSSTTPTIGNNLGDYFIGKTSCFQDQIKFPSYSNYMDACKHNQIIDELIHQKGLLKKEIMELHRQNFVLENEKEKLIDELINTGICNNHQSDSYEYRENYREDDEDEVDEQRNVESTKAEEESDAKAALIEELEAKLAEAQDRCGKLEKENGEFYEKVFELEMDKQRLNLKLHHYAQVNKNLEENNDELEKEVATLQEKTEKLTMNLEKLEQKIERIEEGDFEHVSVDI